MCRSSWDELLLYYKEHFNLDEEVVNLMADYDIVFLSATGASNESISNILDIDIEVVPEVLARICDGFTGWTTELSVNPYLIYQEAPDSKWFIEDNRLSGMSENDILSALNLVRKFTSIEEKINETLV